MSIRIVDLARQVARRAHQDQVDNAGRPYMEHVETVAARQISIDATVVALLHDVLEDGGPEFTAKKLLGVGFSNDVVEAVVLLTRIPNEEYGSYITRIGESQLASLVKIADLEHNMDVTRLSMLTGSHMKRVRKYHQAWRHLTDRWGQ